MGETLVDNNGYVCTSVGNRQLDVEVYSVFFDSLFIVSANLLNNFVFCERDNDDINMTLLYCNEINEKMAEEKITLL